MAERSNNACAVLFIQSAGNTCLPASLVALAIDNNSSSDIFTAECMAAAAAIVTIHKPAQSIDIFAPAAAITSI